MKKLSFVILLSAFITKASYSQSSVDPSYGDKGVVKTDFNLSKLGSAGRQILLQDDGSFLEIVESVDGLTVLSKISSAGQRDISYGTQGYSLPLNIMQAVAAMQSDGKVVIAGSSEVRSFYSGRSGETDLTIARFNKDGSLDNTFGIDGVLIKSLRSIDEAKKMIIKNDGEIIVFSMGDSHWFAVSAFLPDGSPDNTFDGINYPIEGYAGAVLQDNNKVVLTDYSFSLQASYTLRLNTDGSFDDSFDTTTLNGVGIQTMQLQSDGKILLAAYTQFGSPSFFLERFLPDGSVDASFGSKGIVITDFSGNGSIPINIAFLDNNKILVSGYGITSGDFPLNLARYNTDGSLDKTFSGDGLQITKLGDGSYTEYLTAIQQDNKFLVAYTDNNHFAVARFNVDGNFDKSFNQHGILNEGIIMGSTFYMASALQTDGKLVTAGYTNNNNDFDFALARYNIDGTPDPTFSGDGKQVTNIKSSGDTGYAVVIQNNGKVIVAGSSIIRYKPDGSVDNTYGKNGIIASGNWKSAALQSDGKLVVAGNGISRFNTDGSADNTFGSNGIISGGTWYAVAIQANGKIVAAGGINNFEIARFNSNGTPDKSFSGDGFESTHIYEEPGADDIYYAGHARAIAIQADGKIVLSGDWRYTYRSTTSYFGLARYNTDGSLDNTFGQDGTLKSISGYATSLVIAPDGKIIAGGSSDDEFQYLNNLQSNFQLARYNPDGSLDNDFNGKGYIVTPMSSAYNIIQSLSLANNHLYAVGHGKFPNDLGVVVRYFDVAGGPLPLTLTRLAAVSKIDGRLVSWTTENESNIRGYDVERSLNPLSAFEKITSVNALNKILSQYDFLDNDNISASIIYYRLKIFDADGKITYSRIVNVRNEARPIVRLYPNPAKDYIILSLQEKVENARISIFNYEGKVVARTANFSGRKLNLNISTLPAGAYTVQLLIGDNISVIKFIK